MTSSVRSRLMKSKFNHILIIVLFLYIAQLVYLGYTEKIDVTIIIIESLFAIKLLLLYIKNVLGEENNDLPRSPDSSECLPDEEQKTENPNNQPIP